MWENDFEKRKDYLICSLFHDIPLLSPVQEEDESFDSPQQTPESYRASSPIRPYSPLPTLIIEVEHRPNLHDESDEFYIQLEKKVVTLYRQLIIEGHNRSSVFDESSRTDLSDDSNYLEAGNVDKEIELEHSRSKLKRTKSDESSEESNKSVASKKYKNDDSSTDYLPNSAVDEDSSDKSIVSSNLEEDINAEELDEHTTNIRDEKKITGEEYVTKDPSPGFIEERNKEQREERDETEEFTDTEDTQGLVNHLNIVVHAQIHRDGETNDDLQFTDDENNDGDHSGNDADEILEDNKDSEDTAHDQSIAIIENLNINLEKGVGVMGDRNRKSSIRSSL